MRDFQPTIPSAADLTGEWVASGLRARVLLPVTLAVVLSIVVAAAILVMAQLNRDEASGEEAAVTLRLMVQERTSDEVLAMQSLSILVLRDEGLVSLVRKGDREALLTATLPFFHSLTARDRVSHLYFIRPDRTVLLRTHHPARHDDRIDRFVLREAQRTMRPFWGYEQGPNGAYTLRIVSPWVHQGELIGYLELGIEFEDVLAGVRRALNADVLVALDKALFRREEWESMQSRRPTQGKWEQFPGMLLLSQPTHDLAPDLLAFLERPGRVRADANFRSTAGNRISQVATTPLRNLRGEIMGDLVMVKDLTNAVADTRRNFVLVVLACAAIAAALMLFLHALLGRVQREMAARTDRLAHVQHGWIEEQHERHRAEHQLTLEQERNELLEARSRMVDELAAAKQLAETALHENKEVTERLVKAQSELMAAARDAGRAEIATNVLHNVGNVLNSVNVSAGLIANALRGSRVTGLARAMQLIAQHDHDLGAFLTGDEKGRLLPAYLVAVAEALEKDRDAMLEELKRLAKSIDHIKDIVATQQAHAVAGAIVEAVLPGELADEAIRMQGSSLARHEVAVVRDYDPMKAVPIDRGRVLQILVNLIGNAKAAMAAMPDGRPRRLTVRVGRSSEDTLRFSVRDEGEGIHADNLTRIFSHGFTTRKEGHGFGLHSSALAARELGGALNAASEGPGTGATFTLDLPLTAAALAD